MDHPVFLDKQSSWQESLTDWLGEEHTHSCFVTRLSQLCSLPWFWWTFCGWLNFFSWVWSCVWSCSSKGSWFNNQSNWPGGHDGLIGHIHKCQRSCVISWEKLVSIFVDGHQNIRGLRGGKCPRNSKALTRVPIIPAQIDPIRWWCDQPIHGSRPGIM